MKIYTRIRINILPSVFLFLVVNNILAQSINLTQEHHSIPPGAIKGNVFFYQLLSLSEVELVIKNNSYTLDLNSKGDFTFPDGPETITRLDLRTNVDYLSGVNVGDIIKIQNHILGKTALDKPNKAIAADINADGQISIGDIVEVRKLILGKIDKFNIGKSWTFVDGSFPLFLNNWQLVPHFVMYDPADTATVLFKAIKLGDTDLQQKPGFQSDLEERNINELVFEINNSQMITGQRIEIPVTAKNYNDIQGFQMSLNYNPDKLTFKEIIPANINMNQDYFNADKTGKLTFVFDDEANSVHHEGVLFTLVFDAKDNGNTANLITLDQRITEAIAFDASDNPYSISLITNGKTMDLSQNKPNPFNQETNIGYNLAENSTVMLKVFDVTGSILKSKILYGSKGYNSIVLRKTDLDNRTGVMFYSLSDGQTSLIKKMVLLD